MISKNDIIKMAQHIGRRGNDIKDRTLLHPNREWAIGLLVFLLFTLGGAGYNAYIFNYYASMEEYVTANDLPKVEYKQPLITRVLEDYDARDKAFESFYLELSSTATTSQVSNVGTLEIRDGAGLTDSTE